ncbi:hypothetical protein [Streptomyces sp. NPDC018584]|uniref:hypothetical protein n=1 Tax=unclassified Streptomyces TaxID=2593676 RepID=UPI0037A560B0
MRGSHDDDHPATADNFATPVEDRYFEDYVPGTVHVLTELDTVLGGGRDRTS